MADEIWTIGCILKWTEQYFAGKGIDSPRLDGEILLSHVLQKERIYCYAHYDQPLTGTELNAFRGLIKRRVEGYSVASITGHKEFMGISFSVNEHVLIPRPDTETLVEGLLNELQKNTEYRILDLCVGSGAILFSLLHYLPQATGIGVDISSAALAVAEENCKALGLEQRATLVKSNLFEELPLEQFDVITSNPPYIPTKDIDSLATEVLHEPRLALDGGPTGLDFYRRILRDAVQYLKPNGILAVEIGVGQSQDVQEIGRSLNAFEEPLGWKDLNGIVRALVFIKQ